MRKNIKKVKKYMRGSVYMPLIIVGVIVLVIGFFIVKGYMDQSPSVSANGDQVKIEEPKSEQAINKIMLFPLKNSEGEEVSKLKYEILDAEVRDEIIVKGQKASAIEGRTFLIVNIKITNDYDKPVELRARDYVRLQVKDSEEKLAAEIHNDPAEVQALSTKYTRLGFPINESDTDLTLIVGEIGGKKEEIKLNLK